MYSEYANKAVLNCLTGLKCKTAFNYEHLRITELHYTNHLSRGFLLEKCDLKAASLRGAGNSLFQDNKFSDALIKYNESLCYATTGSQNIGIAYANRSAVYLKTGYYHLALENIKLARENNYPIDKTTKLDERKKLCLEKLKNGTDKEDHLKKYEDAWTKMMDAKLPANPKYPFYIADCLSLETSKKYGKHLRCNADVPVGTILAIEEPLIKVSQHDSRYKNCDNCLQRSHLNLFPCTSCVSAMYCSEKCREESFQNHHRFVCGVVDFLDNCAPNRGTLFLKMFCVGLNLFGGPKNFAEALTNGSNSTAWDMDVQGLDELEVKKKLWLALYSLQDRDFEDNSPDNRFHFEYFASFVASVLNFSNLKDILKSEDEKALFRKFCLNQWKTSVRYFHEFPEGYSTTDRISVGGVRYIICAFFKHSCVRNVYMADRNSKTHIVAIRPIKKGDILTAAFGDTFEFKTHKERMAGTSKIFGICECEACKEPEKYPLMMDLEQKDFSFLRFVKNIGVEKIVNDDNLDAAVEGYEKLSKYTEENDARLYPSTEIYNCQAVMRKCIGIFSKIDDFSKAM